jgi:hypothetical protein
MHVEREGQAYPAPAHDRERRTVDEGKFLVVEAPEQIASRAVDGGIDVDLFDSGAGGKPIEEAKRGGMVVRSPEQRVGLPNHEIGGDEGKPTPHEHAKRRRGVAVPAIIGHLKRVPRARVYEDLRCQRGRRPSAA